MHNLIKYSKSQNCPRVLFVSESIRLQIKAVPMSILNSSLFWAQWALVYSSELKENNSIHSCPCALHIPHDYSAKRHLCTDTFTQQKPTLPQPDTPHSNTSQYAKDLLSISEWTLAGDLHSHLNKHFLIFNGYKFEKPRVSVTLLTLIREILRQYYIFRKNRHYFCESDLPIWPKVAIAWNKLPEL